MTTDAFCTASANDEASRAGDAQVAAGHAGADHTSDAQDIADRASGSPPAGRAGDACTAVHPAAHRSAVRELTREEYERLGFDEVRCTGCTPCCVSHAHFLYQKRVLWACQHKLKKRMDQKENLS